MDMHAYIFRMVAYIFFGIVMEVLVSSVTTVGRIGWNMETRKMIGSVSVFMAIFYGPGLLFIFEPIRAFFIFFPPWIQFLAYGCVFTLVEFLIGLFCDKVCKIKLWDYSTCDDSIMGYTRTALFFQWGFCGLMLSSYSGLIQYMSSFVANYFR